MQEHQAWLGADRYSLEEILAAANHGWFYSRRKEIRANVIRERLRHIFRPGSKFSALELAYLLKDSDDLSAWVAQILSHGHWHFCNGDNFSTKSLVFGRIIHTLGSALLELDGDKDVGLAKAVPGLDKLLSPAIRDWLGTLGLELDSDISLSQWATKAQDIAFESLGRTVVSSGDGDRSYPHSVLRSDEIVWARAPARVDIGGGWTDTPPHSLEHGGCVVNAAIDLNGQPPIQAYVRVIDKKVIRIGSIDLGERIEISELDQLLDYRKVGSGFALAKAALVLSGLSADGISLKKMLERFGGGIELTTLAAIPKGSGLGTSSIMGAVIVAAVERMMGRQLTQRQLFHRVLQLEQALTTGGGWQDQIGGVVDGVKMIVAEPGLVPDARIHYMPPDVLAPGINGGQTLLYYTGITRLAKNILQQVVGRYLNRDRQTMATLRQIGLVAHEVTESLICKDIARFGYLIDRVWQLNKQLDPNSSTDEIESLLKRIRPNIYGAKLLGAGGGGFLLIVCRSVDDAMAVREKLESEPTNERGRFFDFGISNDGLTVSVC